MHYTVYSRFDLLYLNVSSSFCVSKHYKYVYFDSDNFAPMSYSTLDRKHLLLERGALVDV